VDSTYFISIAPVAKTYNLVTSYYDLLATHTNKWAKIASLGKICDTCGIENAPYVVAEFEESATNPTHGITHELIGEPYPQGFVASLNGMELRRGTPPSYTDAEYSLTWEPGGPQPIDPVACFYIKLPVYQYDKVKVWYFYRDKKPNPLPD
jgi:hypothetical protein